MIERTAVVVVGAGITGAAVGYHLGRLGTSHLVLEASDRPGGVIRSGVVDGRVLEWGPQRTRLTEGVRAIVDQLGLAHQAISAPTGLPLYVYRAGKLRQVPFSALEFVRSDIVSLRGRLRALLEPLTAGARPDETVAHYFSRKLGRELYESLAGPLYGGLYASDPADMIVGLSLGHALAELRVGRSLLLTLLKKGGGIDPPPILSFREGMEVLPRALCDANLAHVRLGAAVRALGRDRGRWTVDWDGGTIVADAVVLTVAAPSAATLLAREAPAAAEAIRRLRYNPLGVVHLDAETNLHGLGFQVALGERLVTRGVTFNDSLFARAGVYTAYLGGAKAPEVTGWTDAELAAVAIREFRAATGFHARALSVAHEVMPAWDASWSALKDLAVPANLILASNWQSRPGIAGRLAQAKRVAESLSDADLGVH